MSLPAAFPALAVLAGVVAGSLLPTAVAFPLAVVTSISWAGAVVAFVLRSLRPLMLLLGVAFVATGSLLAVEASSRAIQSPLGTLYDPLLSLAGRDAAPVSPVIIDGRLRRDATPTEYGASLSVAVERDVGQGDAALVRLPNRRSLLVDTGGSLGGGFDVGSRTVARALWAVGVRRLDYLALTHGDPDHIGGAAAVLCDFRPREVWEGVSVPSHQPMSAIAE